MMKRILLALTFVAALGAAAVGMASTAEAGHGCHRGYGGHGYRAFHSDNYYSGGYGPRFSYYRSHPRQVHYYRGFPHHHHHRDRSGIYFSIGF